MNKPFRKIALFFLWVLGLTLTTTPYIYTSRLYPITWDDLSYKRTHMAQKRPKHFSGLIVSLLLIVVYLYKTQNQMTSLKTNILTLNWRLFSVLFTFVTLTGVLHSLFYSSLAVSIFVGFTYFLGIFGVYSMWTSITYKKKQKRWLMLFMGFLSVLIAYFALEAFLRLLLQ